MPRLTDEQQLQLANGYLAFGSARALEQKPGYYPPYYGPSSRDQSTYADLMLRAYQTMNVALSAWQLAGDRLLMLNPASGLEGDYVLAPLGAFVDMGWDSSPYFISPTATIRIPFEQWAATEAAHQEVSDALIWQFQLYDPAKTGNWIIGDIKTLPGLTFFQQVAEFVSSGGFRVLMLPFAYISATAAVDAISSFGMDMSLADELYAGAAAHDAAVRTALETGATSIPVNGVSMPVETLITDTPGAASASGIMQQVKDAALIVKAVAGAGAVVIGLVTGATSGTRNTVIARTPFAPGGAVDNASETAQIGAVIAAIAAFVLLQG